MFINKKATGGECLESNFDPYNQQLFSSKDKHLNFNKLYKNQELHQLNNYNLKPKNGRQQQKFLNFQKVNK